MTTLTNFVSSNHLSAIERLGERVEGTFTAEDAITKANLGGWNVRKEIMYLEGGREVPNQRAIVRDNPATGNISILGTVGANYRPIQNEQHVEFLNVLVDESGANFELAGAIDGGRRVFVSMKLPGHINVGGVDPTENSILAINDHVGGMAFTLMVTPIRYACKNVLNLPFAGMTNAFKIRHTSGAEKALRQQARAALDLTFDYLEDGFTVEAEDLINRTLTQARFEEIITKEFSAPEDAAAAAITRAENKIDKMVELFAEAQTQDGIRDTAWAGLNAMTEWADHFSPTRGDDRDNTRAAKALLSPGFKVRALELMKAV